MNATETATEPETMLAEAYTAAGLPLPPAASLCSDEKLKARFWSKVTRKGKGPKDCWEWQARCEEKGYGQFSITHNKRHGTFAAHRVSFMLANGRWPSSALMVLHSCDNPACQNPAHLREGTAQDNQDDIDARGRRNPRRTRRKGAEQWRGGMASEAMLRGGSKLSAETVKEVRATARGASSRPHLDGTALLLALDHGVTENAMVNAITGKTFQWVPGADCEVG